MALKGWFSVSEKKRRTYSPDFREEAAKMVTETGRTVAEVARELGLNQQSLRNWVQAHQQRHDASDAPLSTSERARLRELENENRQLRKKTEFLGKAAAFFASEYQ